LKTQLKFQEKKNDLEKGDRDKAKKGSGFYQRHKGGILVSVIVAVVVVVVVVGLWLGLDFRLQQKQAKITFFTVN
jgi:hypothetical protein